jgi:hypothetical protein
VPDRCDVAGCTEPPFLLRDAETGEWCARHWNRAQWLDGGSILACPYPRLELAPGVAVIAGLENWHKFARRAAETDLLRALARLHAQLAEDDGPPDPLDAPALSEPGPGEALPPAERDALPAPEPERVAAPPAAGSTRGERPHRLGTLGADGLYLLAGAGPQCLPVALPANVGALFDLAERYHVARLFVHPAAHAAPGLPAAMPEEIQDAGGRDAPHPFFEAAGPWSVQPAGVLSWWLHGFQRGRFGAIDIAFPAFDWNGWEQQAAEGRGCWTAAADAGTLLRALHACEQAIGTAVFRAPGRTGAELLRELHRREHGLKLAPAVLPEPATVGAADGPLVWRRPLTERERGRRYLHAYDKHGMFLGACSALPLGFGTAAQHTGPELRFDPRKPGYWRARITPPERGLRPPLFPTGANAAQAYWYTTAAVTYALEARAQVELEEAWLWSEQHRALEPWYKRLRDARTVLSRPGQSDANEAARRIALTAVKQVYTRGLSWFAATADGWDRTQDALYRPDWYHAVMGLARVNLLRNIDKLPEPPFMVGTDCLYFTSDEADPQRAAPPELRLDDTLAGYGVHDAAVPLAELLPLLDSRTATVNDIQRWLNQWRRQAAPSRAPEPEARGSAARGTG